jgi:uncharacterized protein (TIGR01244 family)
MKLHVMSALCALALSSAGFAAGDEPRARLSIHAFPSADDLVAMKKAGATRVINFRSSAEMAEAARDLAGEARALGLTYHHIPVGGGDGISPAAARALDRILATTNGDVVLFCRSGMRAAHALAARYMINGMNEAGAKDATGWSGVWSQNLLDAMAPASPAASPSQSDASR